MKNLITRKVEQKTLLVLDKSERDRIQGHVQFLHKDAEYEDQQMLQEKLKEKSILMVKDWEKTRQVRNACLPSSQPDLPRLPVHLPPVCWVPAFHSLTHCHTLSYPALPALLCVYIALPVCLQFPACPLTLPCMPVSLSCLACMPCHDHCPACLPKDPTGN